MKIRLLSDLHLESLDWTPPKVECDVVVLAGDIHLGAKAIPWIEEHFAGQTVIYVQGNHEGYRSDISATQQELNDYCTAQPPIVDLRYLHNEWTLVALPGQEAVWFFGGTLWTDFALDGLPDLAMRLARQCMNDYRLVRKSGERLTPEMTVAMHKDFLAQLASGMPYPASKTVVVGHHLPSRRSIDPDYRSSEVNPAYASNLDHLMEGPCAPALWVHGHTHRSKDYVQGNTRVVCNPRGYAPFDLNPGFEEDLVLEV